MTFLRNVVFSRVRATFMVSPKKLVLLSQVFSWKVLTFFAISGAVLVIVGLLLPSRDADYILIQVEMYYSKYGYWIVFGAALIEGLVILSWYFPGSIVVLLGAVFSADGNLKFPIVIFCGVGGFLIACIIDYYFGYYSLKGLSRWFRVPIFLRPVERYFEKYGPKVILFAYIHPHLAAAVATTCGVMHLSPSRFLGFSFLGLMFWGYFWGVLAYLFGRPFLEFLGTWWLPLGLFAGWLFLALMWIRRWQPSPV